MATATVTSKGQITIPKEIRDEMGISRGDRVELRKQADGTVVLEKATLKLSSLRGMLGRSTTSVSIEAMDKAIKKGASSR